MKKIILSFIAITLIGLSAKSQITLEKDFGGSVLFAYLESNAYYSTNFTSNQVMIYGLDFNLQKTIGLNPPSNMYLYEVAFVSTHVFNDDDLIELLAVFYNYTSVTDTSGYFYYTTRVVNENGSVLLDIPDGGYSDLIRYTDGAIKLLVYLYDFSTSTYATNTMIYGLPGSLPSSMSENSDVSLQNPFPNPASSFVNIPYKMNNDLSAELILVDVSGHEVNRINLSSSSENFLLNTANLKPGQYIYYIETNGKKTLARKIIVK